MQTVKPSHTPPSFTTAAFEYATCMRDQGLPSFPIAAFAKCMRSHDVPGFPDPTNQGQLTQQMISQRPSGRKRHRRHAMNSPTSQKVSDASSPDTEDACLRRFGTPLRTYAPSRQTFRSSDASSRQLRLPSGFDALYPARPVAPAEF
jgi:hypothetical protein